MDADKNYLSMNGRDPNHSIDLENKTCSEKAQHPSTSEVEGNDMNEEGLHIVFHNGNEEQIRIHDATGKSSIVAAITQDLTKSPVVETDVISEPVEAESVSLDEEMKEEHSIGRNSIQENRNEYVANNLPMQETHMLSNRDLPETTDIVVPTAPEEAHPEEEISDDDTNTDALQTVIFQSRQKNFNFDEDDGSISSFNDEISVDDEHFLPDVCMWSVGGTGDDSDHAHSQKKKVLNEKEYLAAIERTGEHLQKRTTMAGLNPFESENTVFKILITKGKKISPRIAKTLASWNPSKESQAFLVKYSKWPKMAVFEQALDYFYCMEKENQCGMKEILKMKGFTIHFQKESKRKLVKVKFHKLWTTSTFPRPERRNYISMELQQTTERLQTFMEVACTLSSNKRGRALLPSVSNITGQSNDFLRFSRNLVKVMFISLVVFEHFFKLEQNSISKTKGFKMLLSFIVEVTKKGRDFTKHWRIIENFLRVFSNSIPTMEEQVALDELLQNPSNIAQFVRTRARDPAVSPEKYRDKLIHEIEDAFHVKAHVYFGTSRGVHRLILAVRWYVFSLIYQKPDRYGIVFLNSNTTEEQRKAQRERHLSLKDLYPEDVEYFYGDNDNNASGIKKKKARRNTTNITSLRPRKKRLSIQDVENDEQEDGHNDDRSEISTREKHDGKFYKTRSKTKDCIRDKNLNTIQMTTAMIPAEEDSNSEEREFEEETTHTITKRNPSSKFVTILPMKKDFLNDTSLALCIENAKCIKIFELSLLGDLFYHVDFHIYNHRVAPFDSSMKDILKMRKVDRGLMIFRESCTDTYHEFGIVRSNHMSYQLLTSENLKIEWEEILSTILQYGIPSQKRDSEEKEAYRISLGTSNHNYEFNKDFLNPIPRWYCGLDKYNDGFKKNVGILLDAMQLSMDRILDVHGAKCCTDEFLVKNFSEKMRKELFAHHIRFPCVDLAVTFLEKDGFSYATINEHTDDKNGRKKGNNYTVTNSRFFKIKKNNQKYHVRFSCIIYTRAKTESFEIAEKKAGELRTKLLDFKRRYKDSYTTKGFSGFTPLDIKIVDSTLFENMEFQSEPMASILTFPAGPFIEIWASPGLDILFQYLIATKHNTNMGAQLLTLILYQTSFVEFYFQGILLLQECERKPEMLNSFTMELARRLTEVVGHCKGGKASRHRSSAIDWVEHYSNVNNLERAMNSVKGLLMVIENTMEEDMNAKMFKDLISKHTQDFKDINTFSLQRIPIFAALVGFMIKLRLKNAMYAFPSSKDCGSMKAILNAGFPSSAYEKAMKFSCFYFGIEARLYWGENLLCEGGHREVSKMSDIVVKGQRLFFIHKVGDEYIPKYLVCLPNEMWRNVPIAGLGS